MTNVDLVDDRPHRSKLSWAIRGSLAMTARNLLHYVRVPPLLVFTFVQPVIFVLLFRYVFAGTIHIPGFDYVNYLMPGIFGQTVVFGATSTAIGLAEDMGSGIVERLRSLPMVRLSILTGRTIGDLVRNTGVVLVMLGMGIGVGFRPHDVSGVVIGCLIVLAFSYSLSWVMAYLGLRVPHPEAAQAVVVPLLFPLTFASSAFVGVATMPGWLQPFAQHQPVTVVVNACRGLMLGPQASIVMRQTGTFTSTTDSYVFQSVVWIVVILGVFIPLSIRKFNRS